MKILGLQVYQDYNATYYDTETKELKCIELEKLLKKKHFSFHSDKLDYMNEIDRVYDDNMRNNIYKCQKLLHEEFGVDKFDVVCWCYTKFEDGYLKKESYDFVKLVEKCDIQKFHHQENHVLPAIVQYKLDDAICLSIDGKGDGNHAFYQYKEGKLTKLYQEQRFSYGMFYEILSCFFLDKQNNYEQGLEGKFMAYAGISQNFINLPNINTFIDKIKSVNWNIWEEKIKIEKYIYNYLTIQLDKYDKYDLAYTMQKIWIQEVMQEISKYKFESHNFVISGGCALNCLLNYHIIKANWFKHVWYTPIASDVGQSYGAVLNYLLKNMPDELNDINVRNYYFTEGIRDKEYIDKLSDRLVDVKSQTLANMMSNDKIIAICRGNIELGPRALGHRSILTSPFNEHMKEKLNKIKGREWYRPYGILIPREYIGEYFDIDVDASYMNILGFCKDKDLLKGAQHLDGTVRIQTVDKKDDPWLHNLLMCFKKETGHPILINTSFNDSGMPIFNYVQDMFRMFNDKLDGLVIEDKMILK